MSWSRTPPLERLTAQEADEARAIVEEVGIERAKRRLGLFHPATLYKAIARLGVHPRTAQAVRGGLQGASDGQA